jgi:hypothetical protein
MKLTVKLQEDLAEPVERLRAELRARGYAFGALYCATNKDPNAGMLLLAEDMPPEIRLELLRDLVMAAIKTYEFFGGELE